MKKLFSFLLFLLSIISINSTSFSQSRNDEFRKAKVLVKEANLNQLSYYFIKKSNSSNYTDKGFIKEEDLKEIPSIVEGKFVTTFEKEPMDIETAIKKRTNKQWKDYTIKGLNEDGYYELKDDYHNEEVREKKSLKPDDYIEINIPNICMVPEIGGFYLYSNNQTEFGLSKEIIKQIIENSDIKTIKLKTVDKNETNYEDIDIDYINELEDIPYNSFWIVDYKKDDSSLTIQQGYGIPLYATDEEIAVYAENSDFEETDEDSKTYLHTGDTITMKTLVELKDLRDYSYKFYGKEDKTDSQSTTYDYSKFLDIFEDYKFKVIDMESFNYISLLVPSNWDDLIQLWYKKEHNIAEQSEIDKEIKNNGLKLPKENQLYYYEDLYKFPKNTNLSMLNKRIIPKNANAYYKLYKDLKFIVEKVSWLDMGGYYSIEFKYDPNYTKLKEKERDCYKEVKIKDVKLNELTNYYENDLDSEGFFYNVLPEIKCLKKEKILYGDKELSPEEIYNTVKELMDKNGTGSVTHVFGIIKNKDGKLQLINKNGTLFPIAYSDNKIKITKDVKFTLPKRN